MTSNMSSYMSFYMSSYMSSSCHLDVILYVIIFQTFWDSSQIGMYFVIFPWHTFIRKGKGISCHTPPPLSLISIPYFFVLYWGNLAPLSYSLTFQKGTFPSIWTFFFFGRHPLDMSLLLTFQTTLHIWCVVTCYFVFDDILHVILYVILHVILHVIFMSLF